MGENDPNNNEQGDQNQNAKKPPNRLLTILIALVMSAYGFYTMIIAIVAFADYQNLAADFDYIIAEFKSSPIISITASTANQVDCSSLADNNHDAVSIFNYTWSGTAAGCNCIPITSANSTAYGIEQRLYSGSCASLGSNYSQSVSGCVEVASQNAQDFVAFKAKTNAQAFYCAKRLKNYPFYLKAGRQSGACGGGDKKCEFGTSGDFYCVPSSSNCPIVDILANTSSPSASYSAVGSGVDYGSGTSYTLYTSIDKTLNKYPINLLRVGERERICRQHHRRRLTASRTSDYLLMNEAVISNSDCDEDTRFRNTNFKVKENTFFAANGLTNAGFINYPFSTTDDYTFAVRNYLDWKVEAREDLQTLIELEQRIRDMNTYQLLIMIFSILTCIMVSVILTFSELCNACGKDVPCIEGEGEQEKTKLKKIKKCCGYCGKLFQAPFAILAFAISNSIRGLLSRIADAEPGDETTNSTLKDMSEQVEVKVWRANLQIIIGLIIAVLIDILMYIKEKRDQKKAAEKIQSEGNKDIEMKQNQTQPQQQQMAYTQQPQQQQQIIFAQQQPQQQIIFAQQQPQQQIIFAQQQPQQQQFFQPVQQQQIIYAQQPQQQNNIIYQQPMQQNFQNEDASRYGLVQ